MGLLDDDMADSPKHDDGCRCQGCCREKFKTIDPERFGKAPEGPADRPWRRGVPQQRCNHTLYDVRCELALPEK